MSTEQNEVSEVPVLPRLRGDLPFMRIVTIDMDEYRSRIPAMLDQVGDDMSAVLAQFANVEDMPQKDFERLVKALATVGLNWHNAGIQSGIEVQRALYQRIEQPEQLKNAHRRSSNRTLPAGLTQVQRTRKAQKARQDEAAKFVKALDSSDFIVEQVTGQEEVPTS